MDWLKKILSGDFWTIEFFTKDGKFKLYVFSIILLYIIYGWFAPSLQRDIDKEKAKIEDLQEKSLYYSSKLMQISLESQIKEEVTKRNLDIAPLQEPPMKIIIETKEKQK